MSTPNPLIPQGSFQSQAARGASNIRIAVATIVAIHLVFFGGLLLQGCKRDTKTASAAGDTNAAPNYTLPPIDSNSLFYTNASSLPAEPSNSVAAAPQSNSSAFAAPAMNTNGQQDAWQSTNLGSATKNTGMLPGSAAPGATQEYTVLRGDSFARIAKKHGTTVAALKAVNPEIDPAKLRAGSKINVPVSDGASAGTQNTPAAPAASGEVSGAAGSGSVYTVKAGDTLTKIARTHGVTISQIRSANNLRTSRVNVGQKLKIPAPGEGGATPTNSAKRARTHKAAPAPATSAPEPIQ